ncbi:MAG TPA: ABC transporter permease [Actinomycetota bacterium]|nr:ABC transporter permease [Actinomycetota bacterium]
MARQASIQIAPVREASGSFIDDWRAIRVVWKRELIRFRRDRLRIVTALAQPVLFLFVLGTGLSALVGHIGPYNYRTFMFPGVVAMTVLFTAIFSAVSIVWDREFGFLREMLVAPARRGAVVLGKSLGGATVATLQGCIMLVLAGLVQVPYSLSLMVGLVVIMALAAFMITAFGLMLASGIQQVQSFQAVIQFAVLPMFFLSGALFPLTHIPVWLRVLTRLDPLSYAVDPMRRVVLEHLAIPPAVVAALNPGMTWGSWRLPTLFELAIVLIVGVTCTILAVMRFSRTE